MPVELQKEVTTSSTGPASGQVSQTATVAQVPTTSEIQEMLGPIAATPGFGMSLGLSMPCWPCG